MAILMGSVVISLGLYFGLRSAKNDDQPVGPAVVSSTNELPIAPAVVPMAKPAPSVDKARVVQQATAELDKHKKSLTEKCLAPSLAKNPNPPNVKYIFNITFNAAGNNIARGVIEDRETSRPEVLQCLDDNFPLVRLPPLGQTVLVDVPFALP
jgi:hypothetical protein